MEDSNIITLFWTRQEQAIQETASKYGTYLFAIANRILHSYEDSEECINDTYMKTWNSIPPTKPKSFRLYLARITRNLSFNQYEFLHAKKRNQEMVLLLSELDAAIPDNRIEREGDAEEIKRVMHQFLDGLRPEARIIFVERYFFCYSIQEIAQRHGFTEGKVKSQLHRMRRRLKDLLEREEAWL